MTIVRFPPQVPALSAPRLGLRALDETDIPAWYARATDVEAADLAGDPVPDSIEEGVAWLQRLRQRFCEQRALRWAIVPAGGLHSVGTVGLALNPSSPGVADFSIVLGRAHWNQGLGTVAARLALHYGVHQMGLQQVRAEVLQRNAPSIRLLEKAGFQQVGVLPPTESEPEVLLAYLLSAEPG